MSYNIYDLILAVQYFKPDTLDFLDNMRNRYTFSTEAFVNQLKVYFQKLPIEVDGDKKILFPSVKEFSIEADWMKLKKIREKAKEVPETESLNLNELGKKQIKEYSETIVSNQNVLISNLSSVYDDKSLWDQITVAWLKLVFEYTNDEWKTAIESFIKDFEIDSITFDKYLSLKKNGLGIKIQDSPKLYYNSLRGLLADIVRHPGAIENKSSFVNEWLLVKHDTINSKLLYPWIQKTLETNNYQLLEDSMNNLVLTEEGGHILQIRMKDFGPSRIDIKFK